MRQVYAPREEYIGDGLLTDYTFDFKIGALTELVVVVSSNLGVKTFKVRGDDVTNLTGVTFDAVNGGGIVSLAVALPLNHNLALIMANDAPLQESEFKNKSSFTLSRFESALDVQSGAIQRLAYLTARSLKASDVILAATVAAFNWDIPSPIGKAGLSLKVNATEDGFEWA